MKRTITIGSVSRQQVRDVTFKDDKGATKRVNFIYYYFYY